LKQQEHDAFGKTESPSEKTDGIFDSIGRCLLGRVTHKIPAIELKDVGPNSFQFIDQAASSGIAQIDVSERSEPVNAAIEVVSEDWACVRGV